MALTQVSTQGIKDGTITNADLGASAAIAGTKISPDFGSQNITTTGNIDCASDTNKVRLGASQDFTFEHNGTINKILSAGNRLIISGSSADNVDIMHTQSEFMAKFIPNGAVELYHNNVKMVETSNQGILTANEKGISFGDGGCKVSGKAGGGSSVGIFFMTNSSGRWQMTGDGHLLPQTAGAVDIGSPSAEIGHVFIADSKKLHLGDSQDFTFEHNGTNSFIVNTQGTLEVHSKASETSAKFVPDGQVELYHNNLLRFQTTTDGCQLQSNTTEAVFSLRSTAQDGAPVLQFLSDDFDDTADAWRLRADGGGTAFGIQNYASGSWENNIVCQEQGNVALYFDNEKMFETEADGVKVFDNNESVHVRLVSSVGDAGFLYGASNNNIGLLTRTGNYAIRGVEGGTTELYHNNNKKIETTSGGVTVTGTCTATSFAGDGSSLTGITSQGKNLIFNGDMAIAQRTSSAVTIGGGRTVTDVDRFGQWTRTTEGSWKSGQQVQDAPADFQYSRKITSLAANTVTNGTYHTVRYAVEGFDATQLNCGLSSAKTVTLSFYVKSSLTGTFGLNFTNSDNTRCYPTTYTISSANTWEQKSITVTLDTSGSWPKDNGVGLEINWQLAIGSSYISSTLDAWQNHWRFPNTATNTILTTNAATFQLTGVQLEVGSTKTDFDHRPYAKELSYCQRYYWKIATNTYRRVNGYKRHDANSFWELKSPVPMRTAPSPTLLVSGTFTNFQTNLNTTQSSPVVNEWNEDSGMGLLHVQSTWSDTHKSIPSWEGYSIEFSAEL